jgi:hypothetical protein
MSALGRLPDPPAILDDLAPSDMRAIMAWWEACLHDGTRAKMARNAAEEEARDLRREVARLRSRLRRVLKRAGKWYIGGVWSRRPPREGGR